MITSGLMSSKTPEWATPQALFDELHKEFEFTLNPCCTDENAKCARHFTAKDDGLEQDWSNERVFMNPPYGRTIGAWVKKASLGGGSRCCLLITGSHGHAMVPRFHIQQNRNSFLKRSRQIQRRATRGAVPVNGRDISQ